VVVVDQANPAEMTMGGTASHGGGGGGGMDGCGGGGDDWFECTGTWPRPTRRGHASDLHGPSSRRYARMLGGGVHGTKPGLSCAAKLRGPPVTGSRTSPRAASVLIACGGGAGGGGSGDGVGDSYGRRTTISCWAEPQEYTLNT
jgi:hypothetical protein